MYDEGQHGLTPPPTSQQLRIVNTVGVHFNMIRFTEWQREGKDVLQYSKLVVLAMFLTDKLAIIWIFLSQIMNLASETEL